ncbi:hypothetical protein M8J76_015616 [Diaphorina citri]|nr:hypothetical protein M8J76_015616 [Diaphorina citri]
MSFLVKLLRSRPSSVGSYRNGLTIQNRFETTKPEVKETVYITQLTEELDETEDEKEARIEKLRNKSRLAENHRNMVNGRVPYPEAKAFYHDSVQYKRRVWARYGGEQSNVYPGIAWPDKEDLEDAKEYERVLNPLSIQEMISIEKNKITEQEIKLQTRYNSILEKAKNNEKFIEDYRKKKAKMEEEAQVSKQQKEKLFNEIRQHFGFNIDPKDEKFQEMLEIKKKEEAKKRRAEKKKQREEKLIEVALEMEKQVAGGGANNSNADKKEVKAKPNEVDSKKDEQ